MENRSQLALDGFNLGQFTTPRTTELLWLEIRFNWFSIMVAVTKSFQQLAQEWGTIVFKESHKRLLYWIFQSWHLTLSSAFKTKISSGLSQFSILSFAQGMSSNIDNMLLKMENRSQLALDGFNMGQFTTSCTTELLWLEISFNWFSIMVVATKSFQQLA